MILSRFALPLENLLNRNLQASLTARRAADEVEGLCLDVGLSAADPIMRMSVEGGRLHFGEPGEAPAGVTLTGDWRRLVALLGGDHTGPGLDLRGDPAVAEKFARLLKHCRPSPEEELARFAGEPFARQAGDAVRTGAQWVEGAAGSLKRNVRDFVQEEARLSPTRVESDGFAEEVERLRDTVGRLSARVNALAKRRKPSSGN